MKHYFQKPLAALKKPVNLLADNKGSMTILAAMSCLAIVVACGSSVDYSRAMGVKFDLQQKLDASVLAGVSSSTEPAKQIQTANTYFKHLIKGQRPVFSAVFTSAGGMLTANAQAVVPMNLMEVVGIKTMTVKANAKGRSAISSAPMCLMAMNETRSHTLELSGTVRLEAPDCNIYGNSNNTNDVIDPHTRDNFVNAKWVATIGGGHNFLENVVPSPAFGSAPIPDPLASMYIPYGSATCNFTKLHVTAVSKTLTPGTYCGGLVIEKGAVATLQPGGTYYFRGDKLKVMDSTLTGDGALIVLADSKAIVDWENSTIRLKAAKTGDYAGLALIADRSATTTNIFKNSTIDIHGGFYMPKGYFNWTNNLTPTITAKWSAFIVDGFSWDGNGTINVPFRPDLSDVPYPGALNQVPKPGKVMLLN